MGICYMVLFMKIRVNSFVGITWGRQQSQQLVPSMVVDLLLQNKIQQLRLMTSGYDIIEIFSATNISITITLGNQFMWQANRTDLAYNWVNDRVKDPINKGVNIVELTIGSEPYSNTFLKQATNYQVVKVLKLIRESLDDMGLGYIKTTTAHGMDVLKVTKFPSEADFREDIKELMLESLVEFNYTGAPFVLYMFPIHFVKDILNYTMEFAFFDNKSGFKIEDGNITYTNAVELMIDSVAWAIRKAGYPDMKIMIGQIGWPTDGYPHANIKNAREISQGDRDEYPTQAKGIVKMPNRWCKFNEDRSKMDLGKIVATNPSVENCEFPVEILSFQDQVVQNGQGRILVFWQGLNLGSRSGLGSRSLRLWPDKIRPWTGLKVKAETRSYIESRVSCTKSQVETEVGRRALEGQLPMDGRNGKPGAKGEGGGRDRDEYPTQAKGIVKCHRWCKFNEDKSKMDLVNKNYDLACKIADCTRLEQGASCGGLSYEAKVSYGFNAFFQKNKQEVKACDFDGLGEIVATNPSVENCEFPC
ncbi:hypothetical protein HAX54_053242 [Datura stramonium]|uniref:X8 domain-containing protein n=1 Tax=Datura stramonium TaxID=4076 RepID=A0ABS8T204_DATST|nr:hypothetical protein [Datura stramonium]